MCSACTALTSLTSPDLIVVRTTMNTNNNKASNKSSYHYNRGGRGGKRSGESGRSTGQRISNSHRNGTPPHPVAVAEVQVLPQQSEAPSSPMSNANSQIHTGTIGTFMLNNASFFTDEELIGEIPKATSAVFANLTCISTFLAHHRAIMTLSKALSTANGDSSYTGTSSNTIFKDEDAETNNIANTLNKSSVVVPIATTIPAYWEPVIRDFSDTQMGRQAAGLRTNTNRESTDIMNQLVESHKLALSKAMQHADATCGTVEVLSKDNLCQWHQILSPLSGTSGGAYRTSSARAGNTLFCPPHNIDHEMKCFFSAIRNLHSRWAIGSLWNTPTMEDDNNVSQLAMTYRAVALSAIYLYGISDVHPFSDGNGRISRISCNWVLRRFLGLPFSITLAATPHQRKEYIVALKFARTAISLVEKKMSVMDNNFAHSGSLQVIFQPLINVLLDRIASAVNEVQRILAEKTRAASAEEEDRIARLVRQRSAAGSCVICLDDQPNIATLCCGHAVHLNCMAEWLANNATCVSCRGPLPQMERPVQPTEVTTDENNDVTTIFFDEEEDTSTTFYDETHVSIGGTMEEDTTTFMTAMNAYQSHLDTLHAALANAEMLGEATTTTTSEVTVVHPRRPECSRCHNQSAADCTNGMCGSCCVIQGHYHCARHNG